MTSYAAIPPARITRTRLGPVAHTDEGAGPPVLAIHGGMGGHDQSWLLARSLFAELGAFRIIALARPGYPGTPAGIGDTPEQHADTVAALMDALGIERALIVAVSAGGPSAIRFTQRHRARCRGLVLVSAVTGRLIVPPHVLARLRTVRWVSRIPGALWLLRRKLMREGEAAALRSIADPELARRTLDHPQAGPLLHALRTSILNRLAQRIPGTSSDIVVMRDMPLPPFALPEGPTLLVHDRDDRIVPVVHGDALAAQLPDTRYLRTAGGDHAALFAHLEDIRAAVARFLATLPER